MLLLILKKHFQDIGRSWTKLECTELEKSSEITLFYGLFGDRMLFSFLFFC